MSDKIDENFIEIDKNATDDTNNDETLGVVTEAIDSVKDKYENSDIQLLLNKIKELEKENKELKEEQQKTVPLGFDHHVYKYINDFDINANLKNLQEKFKERIHYFEGSVDSVKDRMKNVHLPEYKDIRMPIMPNIAPINLKPWIQMAAKSRKIDVALIEDAIPPKKRQLAATIVTFTLLPTCMFLSLVAIYIAIFIDETRIFTTLLAMYFIYMYVDNSHEHGRY